MRVVCIGSFLPFNDEILPVVGTVYTVREKIYHPMEGHPCYRLEEIINEPREYMGTIEECAFDARSFRPVTDISELEKLTKVKELEDV